LATVAAEIVHDHDVTCLEAGNKDLLDIELEALTIDRTIEDARRIEAIDPESGKKCHGLPVAMRNPSEKPLTAHCPSADRRHVGLRPRLVDEDKPLGVEATLIPLPPRPPSCHVRPLLLGRTDGLFL